MLVGLILGAFYQVSINESDTFVKKDQADSQTTTNRAIYKVKGCVLLAGRISVQRIFPNLRTKRLFSLRRSSTSWSRQAVCLRVGLLKLTPETYTCTFCSLVRKTQWFEILTNEAAKVWQQVSRNNCNIMTLHLAELCAWKWSLYLQIWPPHLSNFWFRGQYFF